MYQDLRLIYGSDITTTYCIECRDKELLKILLRHSQRQQIEERAI